MDWGDQRIGITRFRVTRTTLRAILLGAFLGWLLAMAFGCLILTKRSVSPLGTCSCPTSHPERNYGHSGPQRRGSGRTTSELSRY